MKKPGPKIGRLGKKKTYSFTLYSISRRALNMLARKRNKSASSLIEEWIQKEVEKLTH